MYIIVALLLNINFKYNLHIANINMPWVMSASSILYKHMHGTMSRLINYLA